jgi:TonB family protein
MECALAANTIDPELPAVPPGPARGGQGAAPAPRTVFVVLTRSDELLEQVGQVLDDVGEVRHAEVEEEARQFADPRRAAVMLLDAREHAHPELVVERLHAADGTTVIVVFAPADAVTDVARAIRGSAAFAVLPIPIEMEKTRAVLYGAGEEATARRALIAPAAEAVPPATAPRARESAPEQPAVAPTPFEARLEIPALSKPVARTAAGGAPPLAGGVPRLAVAIAAGLLVAVAAAWFLLRDDGTPPEPVAVTATPDASGAPEALPALVAPSESRPERLLSTEPKEALLDRARVAFHERRYTDPDGDNALYFYRSVLAQDPEDGEAREGLDRIGSVLEGRLKSALAEQRTDDAARTLDQLRSVRPADPALVAAEAQIAEARIGAALANGDLERAVALLRSAERSGVTPQRLAPLREQLVRLDAAQRAEQLSRLVNQRIRDGRLVAPPGDNAKHYLGQLLKLPNGKRLGAEASGELARAFAERARRAAEQGLGAEADQWFAEARALGYTAERPAAVTPAATAPATIVATPSTPPRPVESMIRPEADVSPPPRSAVPQPGARPEAQAASRASSSPAATPAVPEVSPADFKRTRFVAPTYPPQALSRGLEGEVRVRITVDTAGRVSDAEVLSGTPPGIFDQAALNAVRKWRFEPVVKGGRPIEASVATTIRFQPDDAQR